MNSLQIAIGFCVSLISLSSVHAQEAPAPKPVVLMLLLDRETPSALQESVKDELTLLLDTHRLSTAAHFRFASTTFSERIEEIRRTAVAYNAEAVIWLEKTNKDTVSLQIVATAPGRSMVRTIEAPITDETESELVLAARGVLEEMQVPLTPASLPPKSEAPNPAQPEAPAPDSPQPPAPQQPRRYMMVGVDPAGSFAETDRSPILLGGTVGFGIHLKNGLFAEIALTVFGAVPAGISADAFWSVGLRLGVGVGYLWEHRIVAVGPYLGLEAPWQAAEASLETYTATRESWWNFRAVPSIDLRIRLHRRIRILLRPGVGLLPFQQVFSKESDGVVLFQSPYLEWTVLLGLLFDLN